MRALSSRSVYRVARVRERLWFLQHLRCFKLFGRPLNCFITPVHTLQFVVAYLLFLYCGYHIVNNCFLPFSTVLLHSCYYSVQSCQEPAATQSVRTLSKPKNQNRRANSVAICCISYDMSPQLRPSSWPLPFSDVQRRLRSVEHPNSSDTAFSLTNC